MSSHSRFVRTAMVLAKFRARGMLTPEMKRIAAARGFTGLWEEEDVESAPKGSKKTGKSTSSGPRAKKQSSA